MKTYVEIPTDTWKDVAAHTHEGPIVMLNLLRFDPANDGQARYAVYGAEVAPLLAECGGEIVYVGAGDTMLIGEDSWDLVILVRYPSIRAFTSMIESAAYQAAMPIRQEALLDSRLLMTFEQTGL